MKGLKRRTFIVVIIAVLSALFGAVVALLADSVLSADAATSISMGALAPKVIIAVLIIVAISVMTIVLSHSREVDYRSMLEESHEEKGERDDKELRLFSGFVSIASRDVRTITNGVFGNLEIANRHLDDRERVDDCLTKIEVSMYEILALINYTEDFGRIETGTIAFARNPLDIKQFTEKLLVSQRRFLADKDISVEADIGEFEHASVLSDEERLSQIFSNIMRVVAGFVPQGETMYVRVDEVSDEESQALIEQGAGNKAVYRAVISCLGANPDPDVLAHMWDFSLEGSERRGQSGLALSAAINKHFAEQMGGLVYINSSESTGVVCTIEMPFDIDLSASADAFADVEIDLSGVRVLLVEDNVMNREIAEELLEEEGVTVQSAENGREAVKVFESSPVNFFDAILMDVVMPEMDGLTATRVIRGMRRFDNQTIPIIAMTANVSEDDVRAVHEAGMNAYLAKPVDTALLLKTLANYVGSR